MEVKIWLMQFSLCPYLRDRDNIHIRTHNLIHTYVSVRESEKKSRIIIKSRTTEVHHRIAGSSGQGQFSSLIESTDLQIRKLSTSLLVTIYKVYYLPLTLTLPLYKREERIKISLRTKKYWISRKESGWHYLLLKKKFSH